MKEPYITYVILALAFVSIVVLIEGLYLLWRGSQAARSTQARKRLRKLSAGGVPIDKVPSLLRREVLSSNEVLNEIYMSIPRLHKLDRLLERAAPGLTISRYFALNVGFFLMLMLIFITLVGMKPGLAAIFSFPMAMLFPYMALNIKANRYIESFNSQLPDAIDYISRSLRAGNPFSASIKAASEDMSEPIKSEFGTTFDEMRYGVDTEDALIHMVERTDSEEVKFFVTAVLVQRTTGGNLAKILDRLSAVMRARARTRREVKVLSTEMRYSAQILLALPFVVAGALAFVDPGYLGELVESKFGYMIIAVQGVLMLIGYFWIRKMVNFRV